MTDTAIAITRTVDARGSFCPGPLMELIRAIRESQVGDVIAVYSSDKGSKTDIPKWVEKAGHRPGRPRGPRRLRRDRRREAAVGPTCSGSSSSAVASGAPSPPTCSSRSSATGSKAGEVDVIVVDSTGQHVYQPGFMYIAMGGERAEKLQRPERACSTRA